MKTITLGILGCAKINQGAIFAVAPRVPGLVVAGIASRNIDQARDVAAQQSIEKYYGSYAALIDDPDIDAIYNPLPNNLHGEWSIRAIEAGKAVLCEKPVATNAEEAARMADRSRALGVPIVEAFHYRYHPAMIRLGEIMASGVLGKLRHLETRFRTPAHLLPPGNIRFQYELAGGATIDPGCYCINILRLATGEEPDVLNGKATLQSADIDIAMAAELTFPGGATAHFHCSLGEDIETFEQYLKVTGENGTLRVDNPFLPHTGCTISLDAGGAQTTESFTQETSYYFQLREFADVVRGVLPIRTTLEDGIKNMKVIDAVYRAAGMRPRGL